MGSKMRTITTEKDSEAVYVIFRVFNVGSRDWPLGLKVYLDPEALRQSGQLVFSAGKWTVTGT